MRNKSLLLAAIGLSALLIRAAYTFTYGQGQGELKGDALGYHEYAVNLLEKGRYVDASGDPLFRMPGYALFMASIYAVAGHRVEAVQAVQCLLGALACIGLFLAGRRLYGDFWGAVAGIAAAGYYGLIEPCARLLSESFASSLVAGFLFLWFCPLASTTLSACAMAAILAAASLARPDLGLFMGALCILLPKLNRRYQWKHSVFFALVVFVVFAPWWIRNHRLFGRLVPSSTQAEAGLYFGIAFPLQAFGDIHELHFAPIEIHGLEAKAFYARQAKALYAATPLPKILRAWFFNVASMFYPFLPHYDWTFMVLLPFWLFSLRLVGNQSELRLPWLFVALYVFVHIFAGGPVSRYRQPISGALILLSVAGARDLRQRWGHRFWPCAGAWAGLNLGIWPAAPAVRRLVLGAKRILFRI